jgi:hypothetical protein
MSKMVPYDMTAYGRFRKIASQEQTSLNLR